MKITKSDIAVIVLLAAVSLFSMSGEGTGGKKLFLISENEKREIPLTEKTINLEDGSIVIEVSEKGARFVRNDCPNKICVKEGWVEKCGQTAVCVPNRYALVIECKEEEYDAVSQ